MYHKIMDWLEKGIKYFLGAALAVLTMITTVEVIRRYLFGLSFVWSEEAARFLLIWLTFVGGSVAFKTGSMVFLDLFVGLFPSKARKVLALFVNTGSLVFISFIFYHGVKYTFSKPIMSQISTGLGVSMIIPYISIPIGFGLMIIFCLNNYPKLIQDFRKGDE